MTAIKFCQCESQYQDEKYGKGKRVHNDGLKKSSGVAWVCTVCGAKKD